MQRALLAATLKQLTHYYVTTAFPAPFHLGLGRERICIWRTPYLPCLTSTAHDAMMHDLDTGHAVLMVLPGGASAALLAQAAATAALGWRLAPRLPAAMAAQTIAFVALNKARTAQGCMRPTSQHTGYCRACATHTCTDNGFSSRGVIIGAELCQGQCNYEQ